MKIILPHNKIYREFGKYTYCFFYHGISMLNVKLEPGAFSINTDKVLKLI